ncbi:hypothetical protein C7974DRAFT_75516 [Boeremia exigua]|uniref:uncharacterized protein n=1 Tax=Boeremia exigua TaxID=749465 RepID=UPI001E8D3B2D|nr:uncharacterized protein C7974DRAFT_75516 [Boeremia exigua]KAH6613085.1 hypothetical protein C7974DRAFT_75516 [Boeremia exigua]
MGSYTAAEAGLLKTKLQTLNDALIRTPFDEHKLLNFDEMLEKVTLSTCVESSEELYLVTKKLLRPEEIPNVYVRAYTEILCSRHFTNVYLPRPPIGAKTIANRFAPTFSSINTAIPALDVICETSLDELFRNAEQNLKPFPFLQLPSELRLQVYDYLVPYVPYIPTSSRKFPRRDGSLPENLSIMRTNKQIYEEVDDHCFNRSVLLIKASRVTTSAATQHHFATDTEQDYADRYTSLSYSRIGRRITQLEIQILPTEESRKDSLRDSWQMADKASLRQICSSLPNLKTILISYPKVDPDTTSRIEKLWERVNPNLKTSPKDHNQKVTLEWIRHQLWLNPCTPPYLLWDLTCFPESVSDLEHLRRAIYSQTMMKESIKLSGRLDQAHSVASSKADLQRWTDMRQAVFQALNSNQNPKS